jgi:hypothetical protein
MPDFAPVAQMTDVVSSPVQAPNASAENYGGGTAAVAGAIGDRLHGEAAQAHQVELQNQYESDLTTAHTQLATMRQSMAEATQAIRTDPNVSIDAHQATVLKAFDDQSGDLLASIGNTNVRRQMIGQVADMRSETGTSAFEWQSVEQTKSTIAGTTTLLDKLAGSAYHATDPTAVTNLIKQWGGYASGLPNLTPDGRSSFANHGGSTIKLNFGQGRAEADPMMARQLFDAHYFDDLPAADQHTLDREIRSGEDRLEAKARAATAQSNKLEHEAIATYQVNLTTMGRDDPKTILGYAARATAIGDTSTAATLTNKAAEITATMRYVGQPATVLQGRIDELNIAEQKNGHLDPALAAERNGLVGLVEHTRTQLKTDQAGYVEQTTGIAAPKWNPSDPASAKALIQYIDANAATHGVQPQYLRPDDAARLQGQLGTTDGQRQVLGAIGAFGDRARIVAKQIGGNPEFVHLADLASLTPEVARPLVHDILGGADALKAAPNMWSERVKKAAELSFQKTMLPAFQSPEVAQAVFANAQKLYAYDSFAAHDTTGIDINSPRWAVAVHRALGGFRDNDGTYVGGIGTRNNTTMVLPPTFSQSRFDQTIDHASSALWLGAATRNGVPVKRGYPASLPVWGDGKTPLHTGDLRSMSPSMVDDYHFLFKRGNTVVNAADGQPYIVDIRLLAGLNLR